MILALREVEARVSGVQGPNGLCMTLSQNIQNNKYLELRTKFFSKHLWKTRMLFQKTITPLDTE